MKASETVAAPPQRVLFVPASGATGSGEYYRCLSIARALQRIEPGAAIHFLLNRDARVERETAFEYHDLAATPSHDIAAVSACIERLKPALSVFDCTGRSRHFRTVRAVGSRLVWISNRPSKRLKAFRPAMLKHLDLHLILEPGDPAPSLNGLEMTMLRLFGACRVRFVTTIAPAADPGALDAWRDRLPAPGSYAVFVAGGGGHRVDDRPVPEIFLEAAAAYQRTSGRPAVAVMGPQYRGKVTAHPEVTVIGTLSGAALGGLLADARLAVTGGGAMLCTQALAAGIPCVVAPAGGTDQARRIAALAGRGVVLAADLAAADLSEKALRLEREPAYAASLVAAAAGIRNQVGEVAAELCSLLRESPGRRRVWRPDVARIG